MNDIDNPIDDRLRDAIRALAKGIEPSARAWSEIDRRVRKHRDPKSTPWCVALLGLACVAIAVSIPAALLLTRADAPSKRQDARSQVPRLVWQRRFTASVAPSFRRMVAVTATTVFSSDGYAETSAVRALDRTSGATRWTRTFSTAAFVEGSADRVVIVGGYDLLTGLDVDTGVTRWTIDLPGAGLGGYEPVVSAVRSGMSAVGLSADSEGDVRPPVVLGLNPTSGEIRWRTPLAEGTDLTFAPPLVADGAAIFLTTLSHPGSASSSGAHAVELGDGSLRWNVPLAAGQTFGSASPVATAGAVHIPSPGEIVTVAPEDGAIRWRVRVIGSVAVALAGADLVALHDGAVVRLDPADGHQITRTTTSVASPVLLAALPNGRRVLVLGLSGASGIDLGRDRPLWSITWRGRLATVPVESDGLLVAATMDGQITAYKLPRS